MEINFTEGSLRAFIDAILEQYESDIEDGTEPHIAANRVQEHALAAILSISDRVLH